MPVTGSWMQRNLAVNPQFSPWVVASNRHHQEDAVPANRREGIIQAPQYQPTSGEIPDYAETVPSHVTGEPRSHQGVRRNPGMTAADRTAVHSEDHGTVKRKSQADGPLRFHDDAWQIELTKDMPGTQAARSAGGRTDLVRGLNAFPENNPGKDMYNGHGWRLSLWQKRWFTHNLRPKRRNHNLQPIQLRAAQPRTNFPGTQKSIYDGTPWGSLDRAIKTNVSIPRMRRQPGFIDEAIVQDRWTGRQASVVDVM